MCKKRVFFLAYLMTTLLACSTSSQLTPAKSTEIADSVEATRHCFEICNSALPKGWYIEKIKVSYGNRPKSCREKIEALQAEIDDLQFELDKLQSECSE